MQSVSRHTLYSVVAYTVISEEHKVTDVMIETKLLFYDVLSFNFIRKFRFSGRLEIVALFKARLVFHIEHYFLITLVYTEMQKCWRAIPAVENFHFAAEYCSPVRP
ncbi:hypothetical protein Tsp_10671 [Trichinella spiralis]|uniref:hypothetical protein n=1 Tax=Trichinella spiralis TaxID=6334 RepID=UPI0001EFEE0F|nr:hypothetical protein Tsp_10671 [Trichinella spiralis]